jgi:hypothetical protein
MVALAIASVGVLGVVVWLLAKAGKVLVKIAEALAAAAVVLLAVWLVVKALVWAMRQAVTYWRTSLSVLAILAWWHWRGWARLGGWCRMGSVCSIVPCVAAGLCFRVGSCSMLLIVW